MKKKHTLHTRNTGNQRTGLSLSTGNPSRVPRFNMHGHLIEFDNQNQCWTWSKWDYGKDWQGEDRVIRRRGTLEFMKMFPNVFPGIEEEPGRGEIHNEIHDREQMETTLERTGIAFIFLHQGETMDENGFKNIEEAEAFYRLNSYPAWDLTEYWFGFDWNIRSWAMYDTFSGELQFTPAGAVKRLSLPPRPSQQLAAKFAYREQNRNRHASSLH